MGHRPSPNPRRSTCSISQRRYGACTDEVNVSTGGTLAGPGRAVHGYDVVAFFNDGVADLGSDKFAVAHAAATYRFASQANLDTFKATARNSPRRMAASARTASTLGKKLDGDPRVWKIVDDRLYLNLNRDIAVGVEQGRPRQYRQGRRELEPHPRDGDRAAAKASLKPTEGAAISAIR